MLTLKLRIRYERAARAPGERDPLFLACHLDGYFDRHVAMLVVQPGTQAVTVGGRYRGAVDSETLELPADTSLCLQSYTTVANPEGVLCRQEAGACVVPLQLLSENPRVEAPLRIHTTQRHLLRGVAHLELVHLGATATPPKEVGVPLLLRLLPVDASLLRPSSSAASAIPEHPYAPALIQAEVAPPAPRTVAAQSRAQLQPLTVRFGPVERHMNLEANLETINGELERYMAAFKDEQQYYVAVHSGTQRIQCPFNPGEQTAANTQLEMPFASFVLFERPRVTARWWQSQWSILARRRNFKDGRALAEWLDKEPVGEQAALALTWCTQFVETLPYISDMVGDRKPVEMFGDMFAMLSGDCEDGACAILMVRDAMRHAGKELAGSAASAPEQKMQARLQHLARQYVDFLCIDGVTASHVGVDYHNGQGLECTAAHAALHCLPRDYVAACLARGHAGHPLLKALTVDDGAHDLLPVLVGEGTGVIDAGVEWDPVPEARARLFSQAAIGALKKQMFGTPGAGSDFYKVVLFGATNLFFDSHRTATFHFTTAPGAATPHRHQTLTPGQHARGVHYTQLMARDESVVLVPYGGGGDQPEFTTMQARIIRNAAKNRIPPPPLVAPAELAAVSASYGTQMAAAETRLEQRLSAWCNAVNNEALLTRHRKQLAGHASVPVNVFPYAGQVDDGFLAEMRRAILASAQRATILHVDHSLERHHACVPVVRLGIHCALEHDMGSSDSTGAAPPFVVGVKSGSGSSGRDPKTLPSTRGVVKPALQRQDAFRMPMRGGDGMLLYEEEREEWEEEEEEEERCAIRLSDFAQTRYDGRHTLDLDPNENGSTPKLSLRYFPDVVAGPSALLQQLRDTLSFVPLVQRIMGQRGCRIKKTPNYYYWVSDDPRAFYAFGKLQCLSLEPHRFDTVPGLSALRALVEDRAGLPRGHYNAVLINYYPDKRATLAAHSDDDPWLYPNSGARRAQVATIASISLGAARTFRITPKPALVEHLNAPGIRDCGDPGTAPLRKVDLLLGSGSLALMEGETQRYWRHAIPGVGPAGMSGRINLTFRRVYPQRAAEQYKVFLTSAQVQQRFGHRRLTQADLDSLSDAELRALMRPRYASYQTESGEYEEVDLHALERDHAV